MSWQDYFIWNEFSGITFAHKYKQYSFRILLKLEKVIKYAHDSKDR